MHWKYHRRHLRTQAKSNCKAATAIFRELPAQFPTSFDDAQNLSWYQSRMSERFGFDLDMAAVRLMGWQDGQWHEIAVEKIDGPDIEERLQTLIAGLDKTQPVEIFLPRDQILYAEVSTSDAPTRDEIETALEGRTPYATSDLAFDFEVTAPGHARVAAIARDTLDEAFAFADVRGLRVAGYSSFAHPADFSRNPDFGTLNHTFDATAEPEPVGETPVPFASNRPKTQPPESPEVVFEAGNPVVQVHDDTPVMQVETRAPPLDPGMPINAVPANPRITTDISASTVSGQVAATLTPKGEPAIRFHRKGAPLRTALVFAAAAILTIGIAIVVWSILPLAPEQTGLRTDTNLSSTDLDIAAAPANPPIPDLPVPDTWIAIEAPTIPDAPQGQPQPPAPGFAPTPVQLVSLPAADIDALPEISLETPPPPPPGHLAKLETTAPVASPVPETQDPVPLDALYIASIEPPDHSHDPFALAARSDLTSAMPQVGPPALPWSEQPAAIVRETPPEPEEVAEEPAIASLPDPDPEELEPVDQTETALVEPEATPDPAEEPTPTLRPTELAAALPDETPKSRPEGFLLKIERDKFGGRTREELAQINPTARPPSDQMLALQERANSNATELAVEQSNAPRTRPSNFGTLVANVIAAQEAARVTAALDIEAPNTSAAVEAALSQDAEPGTRPQDTPRLAIPSNASVARQATVDNAIRLNRVNLVGVYGVPSDRRALVRLKSGRYVKVKVGDKVDGGTVAQITDTQLHYKKGSKLLTLSLPRG